MKTKNIVIIIVVIVLIIAVIGAYSLFNSQSAEQVKQRPISLTKSAIIKVPNDPNATHVADKKGVFYYKSGDDLNITVCSNISKSSGISELKKIEDSIEKGSKKIIDDNVVMFLKDGVYSVFVKNSQYNDTILIQSPSKNLLLQCWANIKFHDPSDKFKFNESEDSNIEGSEVIDAVQQTEKAVGISSNSNSGSSSEETSSSGYVGYADYSSASSSGRSYSGSSGGGTGGGSSGSLGSEDY